LNESEPVFLLGAKAAQAQCRTRGSQLLLAQLLFHFKKSNIQQLKR